MYPIDPEARRHWVRRKILLLILMPFALASGVWFFSTLRDVRAAEAAMAPLAQAARLAERGPVRRTRVLADGAVTVSATDTAGTLTLRFAQALVCRRVLGGGDGARWVRDWTLGEAALPMTAQAARQACEDAMDGESLVLRHEE